MRPTREQMVEAIRAEDGVLKHVASRLGVSRPTVYKWIWQLGLQRLAGLDRSAGVSIVAGVSAVGTVGTVDTTHGNYTRNHVKPPTGESPRFPGMTQAAPVEAPTPHEHRMPRSVILGDVVWRWVRIEAVKRGRSASDLISELIEREMEDEAKSKGQTK